MVLYNCTNSKNIVIAAETSVGTSFYTLLYYIASTVETIVPDLQVGSHAGLLSVKI